MSLYRPDALMCSGAADLYKHQKNALKDPVAVKIVCTEMSVKKAKFASGNKTLKLKTSTPAVIP